MTKYLVYRHGSNKANQSMQQTMPVCEVEARSRDAAKQKAHDAGITVYNNQWLEARPASRCSRADRESVLDFQF